MNSARLWRAVGAHNSAKQSVDLQVYPANTLELTFYFRCRVTATLLKMGCWIYTLYLHVGRTR